MRCADCGKPLTEAFVGPDGVTRGPTCHRKQGHTTPRKTNPIPGQLTLFQEYPCR